MKKKAGIIVGAIAAVAVVVAAVIAIIFATKGHGYRSIKVYQIAGSVTLNRAKVGDMEAYENLLLQAKDVLEVGGNSHTCLLMDEDKYALVEEDSQLTIEASGKGEDTKTKVMLDKGAICFDLRNKLSEKSSFEVTTSNAVMAVRGTAFRVKTGLDAKSKPITRVSVVEGSVLVTNKATKEETLVEAGQEVTVYTDENQGKTVAEITTPIDYSVMSEEEIHFFERAMAARDSADAGILADDSCGDIEDSEQEKKIVGVNEYIAAQYDFAGDFYEGLARVGRYVSEDRYRMKYFFINTEGEVISEEYDWASDFHEGMAAVANYTLSDVEECMEVLAHGYINTSGEVVIPLQYKSYANASDFYKGYAAVTNQVRGEWIDLGEWGGYYEAYDQCYLIDKNGTPLDFIETVMVGKGDGDYGMGDTRVLPLEPDKMQNYTWGQVQNARIEGDASQYPVIVVNRLDECAYVVDRSMKVVKTIPGVDYVTSRMDDDFNTVGWIYEKNDETYFLDKNGEVEKVLPYMDVYEVNDHYFMARKFSDETSDYVFCLLDENLNVVFETPYSIQNMYQNYVILSGFEDGYSNYYIADMKGNILADGLDTDFSYGYDSIQVIGIMNYKTGEVTDFKGFLCSVRHDYEFAKEYVVLDTNLQKTAQINNYSMVNPMLAYSFAGTQISDYLLAETGNWQIGYTYVLMDLDGQVVYTASKNINYINYLGENFYALNASFDFPWVDGSQTNGTVIINSAGECLGEFPNESGFSYRGEIDGKKVFTSYTYSENGQEQYAYIYENNGLTKVYYDINSNTWSRENDNPQALVLATKGKNKILGPMDPYGGATLYVDGVEVDSSAAISLPVRGVYMTAEAVVGEDWYYRASGMSIKALDGSFVSDQYEDMGLLSEGYISFCNYEGLWGYLKVDTE